MASVSLSTQYKDQLRSLNPCLPRVAEHLVKTGVLTRTDSCRVASSGNQFAHLCDLLASKGMGERERILAEIASFDRSQEGTEGAVRTHHKHILSERRRDGDGSGGKEEASNRITQSSGHPFTVEREGVKKEHQKAKPQEMDPFTAQFYTFVCQLLQSLSVGGTRGSRDGSHDPPISEWLRVDLNADQVPSYFPSHLRKSLGGSRGNRSHGNRRGFEVVRLSELLGHFKSHVRRSEAEARERKLLAGKTKLLQSLTEGNAHLEDQVLAMSRAQVHLSNGRPPRPHNLDRPSAINPERGEGGEVAGIKKQLVKSEAQVKELVTTNEQWAIEAGEKASEITVLQIQLQDALEEIQRLRERQHPPAVRGGVARAVMGGDEGVNTRSEVSNGTNSTTKKEEQLERERDEAWRESERLKAQLEEERRGREEERDEIEELKDRAANLRIQAQSKMPTVKEMVALTSENRQLREAVERGKVQTEALAQKLKELQVKYTRSDVSNGECAAVALSNGHHLPGTNDQSGVLVEPLAIEDDLAFLNGVGTSPFTVATTGAVKQTPVFFDETPLAPRKRDVPAVAPQLNTTSHSSTTTTPHTHTRGTPTKTADTARNAHSISKRVSPSSRSPLPPPPNQPEATIVSGVKRTCGPERRCPNCSTVFLTLGEREFQSHVAWCKLPPF